jgi:hypothetical protein
MDKTVLVEQDIHEGERLVRDLDNAGLPVLGAMWFHLPEEGVWRYYVATPLVDDEGPRSAYDRIENVRASTSPPINIPLNSIVAVSPNDPLIGELRIFAGTPKQPFIGGVSLTKTSIGEIYVDDSYIYRMERIIGASETIDMSCAIPTDSKHKWKLRKGKMTAKNGFIVNVEIENYNLRHSVSRNGLNVVFYVLQNIAVKEKKTFGHVSRFRILDGRLRTIENIAAEVEIEV